MKRSTRVICAARALPFGSRLNGLTPCRRMVEVSLSTGCNGITMKTWLARCLAGTVGCGGLALLASCASALLSAGGDTAGGRAFRAMAMLLGAAAGVGLAALVVMLTTLQLRIGGPPAAHPPTDAKTP